MSPFLSMASFKVPDRIVPSGWLGHGPFAFWLMEQLRPKLTVELGTHLGYSYACFCQSIKEFGIGGKVIAVDSWQGDEHAGHFKSEGDKMYQDLVELTDQKFKGIGELKRMYFSDALAHVADGTVELLHVDGRHFYDDAKEDHTTWIPKLAPGAVVLFHDTQVRTHGFGVYKYWAEVSEGKPSIEFEHGYGLGVLQYGSLPDGPVSRLLALPAGSQDRRDVKTIYSRLGEGIIDMFEHKRFEQKYENRKNPLKRIAKDLTRALKG